MSGILNYNHARNTDPPRRGDPALPVPGVVAGAGAGRLGGSDVGGTDDVDSSDAGKVAGACSDPRAPKTYKPNRLWASVVSDR